MTMLTDIFSRTDTKWVLSTFSVMGVLNLASRMNVVYQGAGTLAVGMAFLGILGWIHGIAAVARSAERVPKRENLLILVVIFFAVGCTLAAPWHFFMFEDPAQRHPLLYLVVQGALAGLYVAARWVLPASLRSLYLRHLVLGYATFSCLFQSVAPKVSEDTLASAMGLNVTMAFAGSTGLILVVMIVDAGCALLLHARTRDFRRRTAKELADAGAETPDG